MNQVRYTQIMEVRILDYCIKEDNYFWFNTCDKKIMDGNIYNIYTNYNNNKKLK